VAQEALTAVCRPYVLLGQEFRVTASIGISVYPQDGLDEQTLTKNADIAMYQAKETGKNNFQFYSEKLNANSLERLSLESGLRHALERGEFDIYYQAKRDTASGRITGVEALLRWQHPDLGTILPMQFNAVAEDTGLIVPIGKWVLRTVCLQQVAWRKEGLTSLTMAVALSARQFADEHLIADLQEILTDTGMDARKPADARCHEEPGHARRIEGHRNPDRHRRLRHRVLVPVDAAAVPARHDQDRPLIRAGRHQRGRRQVPDQGRHRNGPHAQHGGRGSGCGHEGAGRLPSAELMR
jgi:hypothetical protein